MKTVKYLLIALLVVGFAATVYAAPVGLTSDADAVEGELWADNNIGLSVGAVYDTVRERRIEVDSGAFEMQAVMARIALSMLDRFNLYVDFGEATDMELDYTILGEEHTIKYADETIIGVGLSALIYRWDNGFEIGANASYRQADLGIDSVSVDGTTYSPTDNALTNVTNSDYTEVQGAVELAWKTDTFAPYVGLKFSDVELGSDYTIAPQQYSDSKGKGSDRSLGAFVGLTITPKIEATPQSEQLSINIEGRFIDEEALSVGIAYKF
ncbi:MAG: hypothetical protein KKD11_05090 [Candidatus Omnitrophica bacterium]|nr:hypothetical protein [Candidatus Omnitrophota bacterium]